MEVRGPWPLRPIYLNSALLIINRKKGGNIHDSLESATDVNPLVNKSQYTMHSSVNTSPIRKISLIGYLITKAAVYDTSPMGFNAIIAPALALGLENLTRDKSTGSLPVSLPLFIRLQQLHGHTHCMQHLGRTLWHYSHKICSKERPSRGFITDDHDCVCTSLFVLFTVVGA